MKHILVMEDDVHNAILFRKVLEKRGGYRVTVTESAEELFNQCRNGDVAVVIMDVSLTNTRLEGQAVNGVELSRRLKADPATARIPVMLATAHAMRGDDQKLLAESGADDYVSKPIVDHGAFAEHVRQCVRPEAA